MSDGFSTRWGNGAADAARQKGYFQANNEGGKSCLRSGMSRSFATFTDRLSRPLVARCNGGRILPAPWWKSPVEKVKQSTLMSTDSGPIIENTDISIIAETEQPTD